MTKRENRLNKKLEELTEMLRAFQGEAAKGFQETNARLYELEIKVNTLVNAHNTDPKTGKPTHGRPKP